VIVNATPLGSAGGSAGPLDRLALDGLLVVDAPYGEGPSPGAFAQRARGAPGTRVVDGLELMLRQASAQSRLFTGEEPPEGILEAALHPPETLVLVGARGSGKTTVGRLVARRLGRPFVDTDEEVERITGRTPGALLRAEGTERFRDRESEAIGRLAGRRGLVVAVGGGALERPANVRALAEGAFPVWLRVGPATAAARVARDPTDRPPLLTGTSPIEEATEWMRRREGAWAAFSRAVVDAEGSVEEVAARVLSVWPRARRSREGER
jgi:shikimate kinase